MTFDLVGTRWVHGKGGHRHVGATAPLCDHDALRTSARSGNLARVVDRQQEQRLLSLVLDGLDDLYDQRFGGPVGRRERDERAEVWLMRLLISVGVALQGSTWETQMMGVATRIQELLRRGVSGPDLNDAVLDATDDLRQAIAAYL